MKKLLLVFVLGLAASAFGQLGPVGDGVALPRFGLNGILFTNVTGALSITPPAPSYLLTENFEGTGYQNSYWVETGDPDEDYAAAPLEGSQSLRFVSSASIMVTSYTNLPATGEIWAYFLFRPTSWSSFQSMCSFRNSANTSVAEARLTTGSFNVRSDAGSGVNGSAGLVVSNTTYHGWLYYKKSPDGVIPAIASFAWSTNGIKPAVGSSTYIEHTNSVTSTTDATRFRFGSSSSVTTELMFDKLRVHNSALGDNPQ